MLTFPALSPAVLPDFRVAASNLHRFGPVDPNEPPGSRVRNSFVDVLERVGDGIHVEFVGRRDDEADGDGKKDDRSEAVRGPHGPPFDHAE